MLAVRAYSFEIAELREVGKLQYPHIVWNVELATAIKTRYPFGIVIKDDDDIVLNGDADEALHELK